MKKRRSLYPEKIQDWTEEVWVNPDNFNEYYPLNNTYENPPDRWVFIGNNKTLDFAGHRSEDLFYAIVKNNYESIDEVKNLFIKFSREENGWGEGPEPDIQKTLRQKVTDLRFFWAEKFADYFIECELPSILKGDIKKSGRQRFLRKRINPTARGVTIASPVPLWDYLEGISSKYKYNDLSDRSIWINPDNPYGDYDDYCCPLNYRHEKPPEGWICIGTDETLNFGDFDEEKLFFEILEEVGKPDNSEPNKLFDNWSIKQKDPWANVDLDTDFQAHITKAIKRAKKIRSEERVWSFIHDELPRILAINQG